MESFLKLSTDSPKSTIHQAMANKELPLTEHCYMLSTVKDFMCIISFNPHNKPECKYIRVPILQMRNLEAQRSWAICPKSLFKQQNEVLIIGLSDILLSP